MGDNCFRYCTSQRTAQRLVWGVVVLVTATAAAPALERTPVPDDTAQAKARELIREIYGPQYDEAKTSAEKTALAKQMLDQAAKTKGDAAIGPNLGQNPRNCNPNVVWTKSLSHSGSMDMSDVVPSILLAGLCLLLDGGTGQPVTARFPVCSPGRRHPCRCDFRSLESFGSADSPNSRLGGRDDAGFTQVCHGGLRRVGNNISVCRFLGPVTRTCSATQPSWRVGRAR